MRTTHRRHRLAGTALAVVATVASLSAAAADAQWPPLSLPRVSQAASVAQTIGVTRIAIDYSRPLVKGREIWGALVPYDQVWRAGANENTRISFSTPVTVQGQPLPAGSYGLHMIPTKGDWTLAFSKVDANWGSFSYDAKDDALRVTATPEPGAATEALTYTFEDPAPDSVRVVLSWEKLRVPFTVAVDTKALTVARLDGDLHGLAQFFWQPWNQAAAYCLQNDVDLDRAAAWVDRSISMNENFANDSVKARLLSRRGDQAAADALLAKALVGASEAELNAYGYQQMNAGKMDAAIATFRDNLKRHPGSWNAHDSLGEALARAGSTAEAVAEYRKALAAAPEAQKTRIQGVLDGLSKK
jgi:hypothetical protein